MHHKQLIFLYAGLILVLFASLAACQRALPTIPPALAPTSTIELGDTSLPPSETSTQAYPRPTSPIVATQTAIAYPQPSGQIISPTKAVLPSSPTSEQLSTATQVRTQTASQPSPTETPSSTFTLTPVSQYPGPQVQSTNADAYPGPQVQSTDADTYPGPQVTSTPVPTSISATSTPNPRRTPTITLIPAASATPMQRTAFPSPTSQVRTGTPGPTPTELSPRPPLSPPPAGSAVTIWHSWGTAETAILQSIIQSFQRSYPDVTLSLQYVPFDDLYNTYEEASYLGGGPSLLFGPAKWGLGLFKEELVTDLNPFVPIEYFSSINSAALASGEYHKSMISLPLSQLGVVMFRNISIIPKAPQTFDELETMSQKTTHGGMVGSYLERGSYFSAANILGLGGEMMNEDEYPSFNSPYGQEWFSLLTAFDEAGAVTFNTNRDLDMFKRGRVGIIIDGTWNIAMLAQAIGAGNLAIDPWPTYGAGHMSGWVESDSIYLNANTAGGERFAALSFMGYLLDRNVQMRLAEVGHIPSVSSTQPRDPLIRQAMVAFSSGAPYPITVEENVLNLYWNKLDMAIQKVFMSGVNPVTALKSASDEIKIELPSRKDVP